jgi:hypothetical protein
MVRSVALSGQGITFGSYLGLSPRANIGAPLALKKLTLKDFDLYLRDQCKEKDYA